MDDIRKRNQQARDLKAAEEYTTAHPATCSEVVERLATCARLSGDGRHIVWDRAEASTILNQWEATRLKELQALCNVDYGMDLVACIKQRIEWRERRVQELEEALRSYLAYHQSMIDLGGAKEPFDKQMLEVLAHMQTEVVDRCKAAIRGNYANGE